MSTTQEGSNDQTCSKPPRVDRGRRSWTPREEALLLASLKELVALGWKSDNGFKMGYLPRLQDAIAREFPGTDLKGTPHITSKITTWKKNYGSLTLMFSRSGVGFNEDGTHTISCTQEQWESIVKADPNAKTMRYKSWPLFEQWKEIFGKDRATGGAAQDVRDMADEMHNEEDLGQNKSEYDDVYRPDFEDFFVDDVGENSTANSVREEARSKREGKGKKRKADDTIKGVADLLGEITRSTNARLDTIATRIGYEFDLDESKKEIFTLLENIKGLEGDQIYDVCEIFADKPERLCMFKGLPESRKAEYVQRLLQQK